jgi:hypothetical protein
MLAASRPWTEFKCGIFLYESAPQVFLFFFKPLLFAAGRFTATG